MQVMFLDVTPDQLAHNTVLQSCVDTAAYLCDEGYRYNRIPMMAATMNILHQQLAEMLIEESVYWVLGRERKRYRLLHEHQHMEIVRERVQNRLAQMIPQLELWIHHDIACFSSRRKDAVPSWNMEGYLQFSAKKLKWMVRMVLQEEYQQYRDEQERKEFIALLQFCVALQPSLLDDMYLTLYADSFTMVDLWGNDLQQIYLDALPQEEYANVQMHDLILSIVITMLPKTIHLFVAAENLDVRGREAQDNLIELLQQVFAERLIVESNPLS